MKIFLLFLLISISLALLFVPGDTISCGGDYSPYEGNGNSVFSPEIIDKPNLSPLFFSYQDYYIGLDLYGEGTNSYNPALFTHFSDSTNIEDWFEYFESKIPGRKSRISFMFIRKIR